MAQINYITQVQIDFGVLALLPQECERAGIRKPLLVTDAGVRAAGLLDRAIAALAGLPHAVFDATPSNPTERAGRAAAEVYQRRLRRPGRYGGGSSIDSQGRRDRPRPTPGRSPPTRRSKAGSARITSASRR